MNFDKSVLFLSLSTNDNIATQVVDLLGVRKAFNMERYLGLLTLVRRRKREAFGLFCDRMRSKVSSWSVHFLSQGGREVFIKAVLQALPTYSMSCFLLPRTLCHDLEQIMSKFWLQKNSQRNGMHWCKWTDLSKPKDVVGMGFSDLCKFNAALLAKQGWHFLTKPNSLVACIFRAKYYPMSTFLKA